jgi:hypothetical protein
MVTSSPGDQSRVQLGQRPEVAPVLCSETSGGKYVCGSQFPPAEKGLPLRPRHVNAFKKCSQLGRRCQIYAVYTQKRDVTRRLEHILGNKGIWVAVLTK